jgi:hypothetical protein
MSSLSCFVFTFTVLLFDLKSSVHPSYIYLKRFSITMGAQQSYLIATNERRDLLASLQVRYVEVRHIHIPPKLNSITQVGYQWLRVVLLT